jgi:putative ABC transport system permease protein
MNNLLDDVRIAVRGFRKTPGVTAVIVLALALGIGVNASCFIYVSGLLLHPFPYPQLDRIMTIWESPVNQAGERGAVAPANFLDLKERSSTFAALSAFRPWNASLSGIGDPERVQACLVTPEFFAALGLAPSLGRALGSEDAESGNLVVSHGFWTTRLGSDASVIGKTVSLNGAAYTIVGVMPEELNFPLENDMWVPLKLTVAEQHDRASHSLSMLGRLKPGVPVTRARAELATLGQRLASEHPETNENRSFTTVPLLDLVDNTTARFILTLLVTAGFVLLLACANVANLLLVRLAGRQREIAIRAAMGASRARIATQLLVESALLALVAGALGLDFAAWNLASARRTIPAEAYKFVGGLKEAHIDSTVVLFTIGASLIAGLLCSLPSLSLVFREAASARLSDSLKESGRSGSGGRSRSRLRTGLAVAEVSIALILLVGAGAMVRTFQRFVTVSPGYATANLLTMEIALPQPKYSGTFYERLLDGLGNLHDARSSAIAAQGSADALYIEGRPAPRPGEAIPGVRAVSSRYFETLRLPMIEGRAISLADDRDHPLVVVLSRSLVRQHWPGENPIGRRVRLSKTDPRWLTVVGICGDTTDWFNGQPLPRAYLSFLQAPQPNAMVYIRTAGDPMQLAIASQARAEVQKIDRAQAVFEVKSMEQRIAEETSGVRASSSSMVMYAFIGLFLAASGIYGVISYSVARRTHEIGVRMALGADRGVVLRMTLREALRIGVIGLGIGVPVALAMIRAMSSALFGVVQLDAVTFFGLTLILAVCAVAAGYIPAWRASRLDPLTALREE